MTTAVAPAALMPKVRWSWLWSRRSDITWNFIPFWLVIPVIAALFVSRNWGAMGENPMWNYSILGRPVHLMALVMYLYGPLIDAPHLWATVARTYTDKEEWATRRKLFLWSLLWFVIGPVVILLPYGARAVLHLPPGSETAGWVLWSNFFTFYALFHINKQHWGFVSLYKRKNGDLSDQRENDADRRFFYSAIWLPFVAMLTAPWYTDYDGKAFRITEIPVFGTTSGVILHGACHVAFFGACAAYAVFQIEQWRKGLVRNGPKLAYLATIMPIYYLTFSLSPFLAAFWVLTTGVGHCAQYHRVVWAYGQTKYANKDGAERRLPSVIFENVGLYIVLGVAFGLITMQSFGSGFGKHWMSSALDASLIQRAFSYLDRHAGLDVAAKVVAAFVGGVRLHHFYVDSKIWRVSKSAALAKNLSV